MWALGRAGQEGTRELRNGAVSQRRAGAKSHISACSALVALFLPLQGRAGEKQCWEFMSERGTTSATHFLQASGLYLARISTMASVLYGHCGIPPSLPSIPIVFYAGSPSQGCRRSLGWG